MATDRPAPSKTQDPPLAARVVVTTIDELRAAVRAELEAALEEHRAGEAPKRVLLTGPEAQHALGISAPTLRELRAAGMPCVMLGTSPRYELNRCLEWLRDRRNEGANAG